MRSNLAMSHRAGELAPSDDPEHLGDWTAHAGDEIERRFERADGSVGWALWRHSPVADEASGSSYFISQCVDMSQRKVAETELAFRAQNVVFIAGPERN